MTEQPYVRPYRPDIPAMEHVFPLPDGSGEWAVRAFRYATAEAAAAVWTNLEEESRSKGNFSLWRTRSTSDPPIHLVIICGRPKDLPYIVGEPFNEFTFHEAKDFALRRARVADDAFKKDPAAERFSMEAHYEEELIIDPKTGLMKPYKK